MIDVGKTDPACYMPSKDRIDGASCIVEMVCTGGMVYVRCTRGIMQETEGIKGRYTRNTVGFNSETSAWEVRCNSIGRMREEGGRTREGGVTDGPAKDV